MKDEATPRSDRERFFDSDAFFAVLDAERISRGMHWKGVADATGVSASTLTRIGQGRRPDLDSFAALSIWAGMDAEQFFKVSDKPQSASSLSEIAILLRRDPQLSEDAAVAIEELVKATYERLKRAE
jgi:transcriptional regulator with XRE-family HTH domain